mmetsp:Transcript_10041/g.31717  ORF Transcript_10041/g.31717 Transcript_10041/m.31717 type:complete len:288 (-) Transcript_10041:1485-2348(-)
MSCATRCLSRRCTAPSRPRSRSPPRLPGARGSGAQQCVRTSALPRLGARPLPPRRASTRLTSRSCRVQQKVGLGLKKSFSDRLAQEINVQTHHEGLLLGVRRAAVPALNVLIVKELVAHARLLEPRDERARVVRVHAVVTRRRREQHGRVARVAVNVVVRAEGGEEGPIGRVRVAVLSHPRRAGEQLVEAAHVEERDSAHDGAPQVRPAHDRVAHEQPAVGAATARELLARRHACRDQVLGHRLKVLVRLVAVLLERGAVPRGPKLAAAADVGLDEAAALLQPGRAD